MLFASLLIASSCQNEEIITGEKQGNYSLTVSSMVDSRTYVADDGKVLWSVGDKLYVYGNNVSGVLTLDADDAGKDEGTFSGFVFGNPDNLKWAVFGDEVKGTTNGAQFTISEISDPNSNSPMVGEIEDGNVDLKHLCGMVRITINNLPENADVKLVGDDIAGTAEWNGTSMSVKSVSDEIKINVENGYQTIEVPVFAEEAEATKNFKLVVNGKECPFSAPVAIGALSEKAIMHITCIVENGVVTGFTQAATTQESLIQALQTEGTVSFQLSDDITLDKTVVVGAKTTATIDLNGKTITGTEGIVIDNQGTLTLSGNGTIENTVANGQATINNSGSLILEGVNIVGAPIADGGYPAYAVMSSGNLTIEDGTSVRSDRGCLRLSDAGETVINGGTFVNNDIGARKLTSHVVYVEEDGTHKLTINGGTFQHLHTNTSGGVVICNMTKGTVYVNGGSFSGGNYYKKWDNLSNYGSSGTFSVTGGTFTGFDNKYLAEGYKATEVNGIWMVTANEIKVVSTPEGLSSALTNGGNVVLAGNVSYSNSITNDAVIDLNGYVFEPTATLNLKNNADLTMIGGDYVVNGTYGHMDIRPESSEGSVVTYEDVDFSYKKLNKTYGPSTNRLGTVAEVCAVQVGANTVIKFKNCTFDNAQILFEGLSGKVGTFQAEFDNCTFNALTSSAPITVSNYVEGTINVTGCTFNLKCTSSTASALSISPSTSTSVVVNASNNTFNAVAATPYTYDVEKGETEEYNVKVNGTPANIKFISYVGTTSTIIETGTTKTGIAAL